MENLAWNVDDSVFELKMALQAQKNTYLFKKRVKVVQKILKKNFYSLQINKIREQYKWNEKIYHAIIFGLFE